MTNPAILLKDMSEIQRIMVAFIITICAIHDLRIKNSRTGSIHS